MAQPAKARAIEQAGKRCSNRYLRAAKKPMRCGKRRVSNDSFVAKLGQKQFNFLNRLAAAKPKMSKMTEPSRH
jgi:hypothetical protein